MIQQGRDWFKWWFAPNVTWKHEVYEGYPEIRENYMTFYTILFFQMERTKLTSVILLNLYLASYMILNGERMI